MNRIPYMYINIQFCQHMDLIYTFFYLIVNFLIDLYFEIMQPILS